MVAVIKFSSSLQNVLNYNENKLKQDTDLKDENGKLLKKAEFIHSSGFAKDTEKLVFTDKFKRIEKQMNLSETRKRSVTHISLNFDPSEKKKLDNETLKQIADMYMQKIGFGNQPYLVYKHNDAGHPHIHIVSTIIKNDGRPIETHNIGKNFSEPARKEIEQLFGLVVADKRKQKEVLDVRPVNAEKIQYGKSETKRAITNVLDAVLFGYKYTSLSELNAVLKQYNVMADQGKENSRVQRNNGLVYRILDPHGNKIGIPIKASKIYCNPGMKLLEPRFKKNEELRKPHKQRVRNAIDLALSKRTLVTIEDLQRTLQRDKIQLVIRRNAEGRLYGLTLIDYQTKCVFNGSDLGPKYSASAVENRLWVDAKKETQKQEQKQSQLPATAPTQKDQPVPLDIPIVKETKRGKQIPFNTQSSKLELLPPEPGGKGLLRELMKPESSSGTIPDQNRKRKRKRKRIHL